MSRRSDLWRELRRVIKAGDTDQAHELVRRLGYTKKQTADQLIENIWQQERTK
ncbi:MAG: hypothetical protein GY898_23080 [Proteobacteria bacterium]|nr:hypothetical protein [Pseudomonadota bacterium]